MLNWFVKMTMPIAINQLRDEIFRVSIREISRISYQNLGFKCQSKPMTIFNSRDTWWNFLQVLHRPTQIYGLLEQGSFFAALQPSNEYWCIQILLAKQLFPANNNLNQKGTGLENGMVPITSIEDFFKHSFSHKFTQVKFSLFLLETTKSQWLCYHNRQSQSD